MHKLLSHLNVIDFSSVLAGPAVGTFFAELGARVTKFENKTAGGDVTRSWKLKSENPDFNISAYFSSVNYGKAYHQVDIFDGEDRKKLDEQLAHCDVFITNYRASSLAKMQLDYPTLKKKYPKLIYGAITGFESDPNRVAYDVVVQAETGFMAMNGTPESAPLKMPVAMMDLMAAHQLKEGLLLALLKKERMGEGSYVAASLEAAGLTSLVNQAGNYLMAGHIPQPIGSLHPNIAPYGEVFYAKDGLPMVMAVGSDLQFAKLCAILGDETLPENPEFSTNPNRVINRVALHSVLAPLFAKFNRAELMQRFNEAHIPAGAVKNLKEVFEEDFARSMVLEEEIDGEHTQRVRSVGFRMS